MTVKNEIDWNEWGNGSFLHVTGNVTAKNVFLAGCPEAYVIAEEHDFMFDVDLDESDYEGVIAKIADECQPEEEGMINVYEVKDYL